LRSDLYRDLYEKEQTYWWHIAKRHTILTLLRRYASPPSPAGALVLDVGCGTGLMLQELRPFGPVAGTDLSDEALAVCRARGLTDVYRADAAHLPFDDCSVHIITALDVVEHTADDAAAMAEFKRVLAPGGVLVISVPAYQRLWSYWDEILGHYRRYNAGRLRRLMEQQGFTVELVSYTNVAILAPSVLVRWIKGRGRRPPSEQPSDFIPVPRLLNSVLIGIYRLETALLRYASLPAGLSVICVARKPAHVPLHGSIPSPDVKPATVSGESPNRARSVGPTGAS